MNNGALTIGKNQKTHNPKSAPVNEESILLTEPQIEATTSKQHVLRQPAVVALENRAL